MVSLPRISVDKSLLHDIEKSKKLEWIITNGHGGYASSTVTGMNTRKYHGLLIASTKPPLNRKLVLSKIEEEIEIDGKKHELSTNKYIDVIHPKGYLFLERFEIDPFPRFVFKIGDVIIEKRIYMFYGKDIVVVSYEVKNKKKDIKMRLRPLVNYRSIYFLTKNTLQFNVLNKEDSVKLSMDNLFLKIVCHPSKYIPNDFEESKKWYWNFCYDADSERGEDCIENAYNPGAFEIEFNGKRKIVLVAGLNDECDYDIEKMIKEEIERKKYLLNLFFRVNKLQEEDWIKWLVLASDNHIIKRYDNGTSIIAGYHWFGEWGRDTFISLPGLCLATGRYYEAREIIKSFLYKVEKGLVPNYLDEENKYNSADASLWLINALYKYYLKTEDLEFVMKIFDKLKSILAFYMNGTEGISMDRDFLIETKEGLTWMDAVVEGKPVTPRSGKAVEIQALWYNALKIMEFFAEKLKNKSGSNYRIIAEEVKENFIKKIWNGNYLNDTLNDSTIRPNQLIALHLPFRMLDKEKEKKILEVVRKNLLVEYGIRTLPKDHPDFKPTYSGNWKERDKAYHNGTIWPWLLGLYTKDKETIKKFVEKEITKYGLGTISELIDADSPFESKGCISQAWSIGCLLESLANNTANYYSSFHR